MQRWPESPPGAGGRAYGTPQAPECCEREGLGERGEDTERPGPRDTRLRGGGGDTETTGRNKGAFSSATGNGGFPALGAVSLGTAAQPCRKDRGRELQPEWEAWAPPVSASSPPLFP